MLDGVCFAFEGIHSRDQFLSPLVGFSSDSLTLGSAYTTFTLLVLPCLSCLLCAPFHGPFPSVRHSSSLLPPLSLSLFLCVFLSSCNRLQAFMIPFGNLPVRKFRAARAECSASCGANEEPKERDGGNVSRTMGQG